MADAASCDVIEPSIYSQLSTEESSWFQRAAADIVAREEKRLDQRYGRNVIGVGHGLCRRRGANRLVVRFFVQNKRGTARLKREGETPVPRYIEKRVLVAGEYKRVRFETDVEELRYGGPQVKKIDVRQSGGSPLIGSACCVVRDNEKPGQFVMSCFHVFGANNLSNSCGRAKRLTRRVDGRPSWIGLRVEELTDLPPLSSGVDAGLCKIPAGASIDTRVNGIALAGRIVNPRQIPLGAKLRIATRGKVKKAKLTGITGAITLRYRCLGGICTYTFSGLLEYVAVPPTKRGDSGSAIVYGSSLVGMHFYLTKKGRALGIPASTLFQRSTFKRSIELV